MAVLLSPVGGAAAQFLDNNGNPLSGGKLYTYVAGTTTPQAVYTTASGAVPHTNPIVLDSGGRVPSGEIWLTDGFQYKFVLKTSTDVLIGTYDNLIGINSNFVNFLTQTEIQTATAGQTVFTLATTQYQPGSNNLSVFVDGVNQYDGASYSYVETSSTVVTFTTGLHVGALVKFTTAQTLSTGVTDASLVTYDPPFTGSVATTVEDKLAQTVSVEDFGAVGDGIVDDAPAFTAAFAAAKSVYLGGPEKVYRLASFVGIPDQDLYAEKPHRLIGNGSTIKIDAAQAPFTSAAWAANQTLTTNPFTGKFFVDGANFIGDSVDGAFDCDHIYNIQVTDCHFDSMNRVFISRHAKSGHPNGYVQSLFVSNCIFSEIYEGIILAKKAYNVVFSENMCEVCDYGIIIDGTPAENGGAPYAIHDIRLINNLFEGGGVFARCASTIAGVVTGNYFEKNTRGDISVRKCHLDLTYDTAAVGSSNPSTWVIDGNSSQDETSQNNDAAFGMFKINGSYGRVSAKGNWAGSAVTVSPVLNLVGNYSRRFQAFNITTPSQQAFYDFKASLFERDLATQIVSTNRFNVLSLQLGSDITATDFRGAAINCSVVLKGKVATGEVFGECSFDLKLFFSPYGSGISASLGKPVSWDVRPVLSNYLEQTPGTIVDTSTGAQTISLFTSTPPALAIAQSGTIIYIRLIGFNVGATISGYGPLTTVTASTLMTINGLNIPNSGSAVNWIEMVN